MISILIVVSWHGHHPSYCCQFIRACGSFSKKVFVIAPEAADPLERLGGDQSIAAKTEVIHFANRYSRSGFSKIRSLIDDYRDLRKFVSSIIDAEPKAKVFLFHTDLGSFFWNISHLPLLVLLIRGLLPWSCSGLLISPDREWPLEKAGRYLGRLLGEAADHRNRLRFLRAASDVFLRGVGKVIRNLYLRQRNFVFRRSSFDLIVLEDERYMDSLTSCTGKKTVFLPETTSVEVADPPPDLVRHISERKGGLTVVGLLGAISPRKGIDLLAGVLRNFNTEGFLFVVAGPCDPNEFPASLRNFLTNEVGNYSNVIFSPHSIPSESEFNAIIKACDILYCAYKGHLHSSNVISKAAAFGKPVLVSGGELMAKRITEYRMGTVLTERTADACIKALRLMVTSEFQQEMKESARFDQFMQDHSFESLQRVMTELSEETGFNGKA